MTSGGLGLRTYDDDLDFRVREFLRSPGRYRRIQRDSCSNRHNGNWGVRE